MKNINWTIKKFLRLLAIDFFNVIMLFFFAVVPVVMFSRYSYELAHKVMAAERSL